MRTKVLGTFLVVAIALAVNVSISAQQRPSETVEELSSAIHKLEAIDQNPQTPAEIKEINRGFLSEKRTRLLSLLIKSRNDRRAYLASAASALDANQIVKLEQDIASLESSITRLQTELSRAGVTVRDTADLSADSTNRSGNGLTPSSSAPTALATAVATPPPQTSTETSLAGPTNPPTTTANSPITTSTPPAANPTTKCGRDVVLSAPTTDPGTPTTAEHEFRAKFGQTLLKLQTAKATDPKATINLQADYYLLVLALAAPKVTATKEAVVPEFTAHAENMKTDKQVGSGQSGGGTTSLVSKPSIAAVFGLAVENGALTRTDNKTTVTFSGTPVGIVEALAKKGFIDSYQCDDGFDRFLRNFSFKLAFDTSRGSTPGTFTGSGQQLSGYSLRYKLVDQRDPRDAKYTKQWAGLVENEGVSVTKVLAQIFTKWYIQLIREDALAKAGAANSIDKSAVPTGFREWFETAKAAIANASVGDVEKVLTEQLDELRSANLGSDVNTLISSFSSKFDGLLKRRDNILNQVNAGWASTIEYNNERRVGLPSLSNIKFVAEKGAYGGSVDLTANASVTFLNSTPTGSTVKRLRDYSFSGQLDVPLGNVVTTGKFFLSFAGQFERLATDEKAGGVVMASKGNIGVGQIKLTIPIRGTALKIPLSISFANRTELIKEKHVRGNFGITFDLDSILAKFNPFSNKP